MKKAFLLYSTLLIYSFLMNCVTAQQTIIFEDDFQDNAQNWKFRNTSKFYAEVYNGNYILKNKSFHDPQFETRKVSISSKNDYEIEAHIKQVQGMPERAFGLVWGMKNTQNHHLFLLNGKGFFKVETLQDGVKMTLRNWTDGVRLINPKGRTNTLKISQKKDKTEFYINGKLAYSTSKIQLHGNQVGFYSDGHSTLAVEQLKISRLNTQNLPKAFHETFANNQHQWKVSNTSTSRSTLKNGHFVMEHLEAKGSSFYTNEIHILPQQDFDLETHLKQLDGKSGSYGLIWGMKDTHNFHAFLINNEGYFKIYHYENNRIREERNWTKTSGVINPFNAFNKLTIRQRNGKISYVINDHLVYISDNQEFYGKKVGFIIHEKLKISADNLNLHQTQDIEIGQGKVKPPEIVLLNPNTERSETLAPIYPLQIGIRSKAKINSANIFVNNRLMDTERGFEVIEDMALFNLLINKKIKLIAGSNAIRIEVKDNYGSLSVKNLNIRFIEDKNAPKPQILWMNPTTSRATTSESVLTLKAGITSTSKIIKAQVFLNNDLVRNRTFEEVKPGRYKYALMIERNLVMQHGENQLRIIAENQEGGVLESERTVFFTSETISKESDKDAFSINNRTDYALFFATDEYDHWGNLVNPVNDAEILARELTTNYGFKVEVIKNADKKTVMEKLKIYAQKNYLPEDQLFIFFAGHGKFDPVFGEGYVVCKNSLKKDDGNSTYIPHSSLRTIINNIPTRHTLLTMDVCFGGTFDPVIALRGEENQKKASKTEFIRKKMQFKTRKYLTSGGKEYVPDGIPGKHSPFVRKFLTALRNYGGEDGILTTSELLTYFQGIKPAPRFGEFGSNEPGSDFIFIAK